MGTMNKQYINEQTIEQINDEGTVFGTGQVGVDYRSMQNAAYNRGFFDGYNAGFKDGLAAAEIEEGF